MATLIDDVMVQDFRPISDTCQCIACKNYSRAALYSIVSVKAETGSELLTIHNIAFQLNLMHDIRQAVIEVAKLRNLTPRAHI